MTLMFRYHLRLARVYLRWRLAGKPRGLTSRIEFRASAFDCDWYGHINNARYLEYLDCGRTDFLLRSGLAAHSRANHWVPVVGGIRIRYRREIRQGARFEIETTFNRIEGKALVFDQRIWLGETLATEAEAQLLVLQKGKVVNPAFLLPLLEATTAQT